METAAGLVGIIVATAALLGAIGYLVNRVRRAWKVVVAVINVINRELHHNGGSSMKDDVTNLTRAVNLVARQVDDLDSRFSDHLGVGERPDLDD